MVHIESAEEEMPRVLGRQARLGRSMCRNSIAGLGFCRRGEQRFWNGIEELARHQSILHPGTFASHFGRCSLLPRPKTTRTRVCRHLSHPRKATMVCPAQSVIAPTDIWSCFGSGERRVDQDGFTGIKA